MDLQKITESLESGIKSLLKSSSAEEAKRRESIDYFLSNLSKFTEKLGEIKNGLLKEINDLIVEKQSTDLELQNTKSEIVTYLNNGQNKINALEKEIESKTKTSSDLDQKIYSQQSIYENTLTVRDSAQESLKSIESNIIEKITERKRLDAAIESATDQINTLDSDIEEKTTELNKLNSLISTANADWEIISKRNKL